MEAESVEATFEGRLIEIGGRCLLMGDTIHIKQPCFVSKSMSLIILEFSHLIC